MAANALPIRFTELLQVISSLGPTLMKTLTDYLFTAVDIHRDRCRSNQAHSAEHVLRSLDTDL